MASMFSVSVGPVGKGPSGRGWPLRCTCDWSSRSSAREAAERSAKAHLLREHRVRKPLSESASGKLVVSGLDENLLTAPELEHFTKLRSPQHTRAREQPKTFAVLGLWALAVICAAAVLTRTDKPEPSADQNAAIVALLVVMFGGIWIVGSTMVREARAVKLKRVAEYLDRIGFQDRGFRASRTSDNDDSRDPRYFVTDGRYDPGEYQRRGGAGTKRAMEAWHIDDYDIYKSNIE